MKTTTEEGITIAQMATEAKPAKKERSHVGKQARHVASQKGKPGNKATPTKKAAKGATKRPSAEPAVAAEAKAANA